MNQNPFLEQLLREGARKLVQAAIENEVIEYIQFHKARLDENGQRLVVRRSSITGTNSGYGWRGV
jgi:putative transposase